MITFKTANPAGLLAKFKELIDEGHIVTWSYDEDGDFTHTPSQYQNKAWLVPSTGVKGELNMYLLGQKDVVMKAYIYAAYHGRFIESMLTHCDTLFTNAVATALGDGEDDFLTA